MTAAPVDKTRESFATEGEREAYDAGVSRGWDHSNFVEAYGTEHERRGPDYPGYLAEGDQPTPYGAPITSPERRADRAAFALGWTAGRRRFSQGRWQDGSKIED